jgi:signal peptidase I
VTDDVPRGETAGAAVASTASEAPRSRRRRDGWLRRWTEALVVAFVTITFIATTVGIEGGSMAPTLLDGERALVPRYETWAVRLGLLAWERGDVVYFRAPGDAPRGLVERLTGGPFLIKRVAATAGQTVELRDGTVLVDGAPVPEPFTDAARSSTVSLGPTLVPPGHLFVLGDNRSPLGSRDSRVFGPIAEASVAGRAVVVVWPLVRHDQDGTKRWNPRRLPRRSGATARRPGVRAVQPEARGARLHRVQDELDVLPEVDAEFLGTAAHVVA